MRIVFLGILTLLSVTLDSKGDLNCSLSGGTSFGAPFFATNETQCINYARSTPGSPKNYIFWGADRLLCQLFSPSIKSNPASKCGTTNTSTVDINCGYIGSVKTEQVLQTETQCMNQAKGTVGVIAWEYDFTSRKCKQFTSIVNKISNFVNCGDTPANVPTAFSIKQIYSGSPSSYKAEIFISDPDGLKSLSLNGTYPYGTTLGQKVTRACS